MDIHTYRCQQGFTLLELMTGLSVTAILTVTSVPAFTELIQRNQLTTEINTFVTHLHYVRSEAVKRGVRVVMCRSADEITCSRTQGWHKGWIIFTDRNANREYDGDDELLYVRQGQENGINITSGRRRTITYQNTGQSPGSNGTYVFCSPQYPNHTKAVIISNSGRPRLSEVRPDGSDLTCSHSEPS